MSGFKFDPLLEPRPEDDTTEHECEFIEKDIDICRGCGEHAAFCEDCGSECCGESAYMPDLKDIHMLCTKDKEHTTVKNSANGKTFWYCRDCKDEVHEITSGSALRMLKELDITPVLRNRNSSPDSCIGKMGHTWGVGRLSPGNYCLACHISESDYQAMLHTV